ncbi:MAG TPA: GH116 family glycosyl-hydrolase, partial [Silvibacterium sp.]|nr:GH116 family glycosyl-hydrolase [Silvibacterium sp.]
TDKYWVLRRDFLKQAAGVFGAATQSGHWTGFDQMEDSESREERGLVYKAAANDIDISYPRQFSGRQVRMISFPLGGVAAGSIGLGGRGQLINWEIYNHPNKGYRPPYAFPSIWAQSGTEKPVARVLESRILPAYEGESGLGSDNAPGLSRLEEATFTGEYPLAHIDFQDRSLPVNVELDAFSPFIPHEADDSGLPVAILRYRVTNPGAAPARVGVAFSVDNPVKANNWPGNPSDAARDKRLNEFYSVDGLVGLLMSNPGLAADDPYAGSFTLAAMPTPDSSVSHWRGWPRGRWWNSPLLFWDQFSKAGELGAQPEPYNTVGVLCVQQTILPGQSASFLFLLGWHFPNRTPDGCGWTAPPGEGKTIIGNHYSTRFKDAWDSITYTAKNLESLEARTRIFAAAFRESTLPSAVKEAASANLSTLATTTCFRTADGEFHGFEGSSDRMGCCFGNCTHVWNYETVTSFLFPSFAKSLRKSAFGYSMDDAGAMHFRQLLPDGKARSGFAAADGQMGQIIHAWLDWKLSGDDAWLRGFWPRMKKAIEFAWVPGGWDSNQDGVLEGVQHNTYDVEFYGPNPMCGIYYLGALRASEEMAQAAGDGPSASKYGRLFEQGRRWIDGNLFNGEYYVQQTRGFRKDEISPNLRSDMGSENTETPEYQIGAGCLVDQLVGQYLAEVGGLGPLVSEKNICATLRSIYRYNYKRSLVDHDSVARTYALNDEAAVVICDYGKEERPHIPFPYYSEAWTGLEYTAATLMMCWGMVDEGIECVHNTRARYDGDKRNPWDEAECGHHYARAMSAWSTFVALSGFRYNGSKGALVCVPRISHETFDCFWATGTGWGTFSYRRRASSRRFSINVLSGTLRCQSCEITGSGGVVSVESSGKALANSIEKHEERLVVSLDEALNLPTKGELRIEIHP